MTLREALKKVAEALKNSDIQNADLEAMVLVSYATGKRKEYILAHMEDKVEDEKLSRLFSFLARRLSGEPLQYITGKVEFFSLEFKVKRGVLIPRPETEIVVETAFEIADKLKPRIFADVGTGSGVIGITLLTRLLNSMCIATDISDVALKLALENAQIHRVHERFKPVKCHLLSAISSESVDMIVSNPPYVAESEYEMLQKEIRYFEPEEALIGGTYGWEISCALVNEAARVLTKEGFLVLETSPTIYKRVLECCTAKFKVAYSVKDLNGHERVIVAGRKRELSGN